MASLLSRSALRAVAFRHLGSARGPAVATAARMTRRHMSIPGFAHNPQNNPLIAAVIFFAGTCVYAAHTNGFNSFKQADAYYEEQARREAESALTAAAAEGEDEGEGDQDSTAEEDKDMDQATKADLQPPSDDDVAAAEEDAKDEGGGKGKVSADYNAPYVLVGAGTASFAALKAIHEKDPQAKVLMIGTENDPPYMRPPLSKELWFADQDQSGCLKFQDWNGNERDVYFQPHSYYVGEADFEESKEGSVGLITGVQVLAVDVTNKQLKLSNGKTASYDKLLIATGGRPKSMAVFDNAKGPVKDKYTLFRKIADYHRLDGLARATKSITIVGGGFLGSELAVALGHKASKAGLDLEVNQVFPEEGNMGKIFPAYLSQWTTKKIKQEGVKVRPKSTISHVATTDDDRLKLTFADDSNLVTDHVLIAVGIEPNTDLAMTAGLETDPVDGGIMVNAELAGRTDVYVAGDVASFHDPALGRRRVEHHDHAVVSGRLAGQNMADRQLRRPYRHQSMFWSDLGPSIGYEAIGVVDNSLETVSVWAMATPTKNAQDKPQEEKEIQTGTEKTVANETASDVPPTNSSEEEYGKGVVFYLRDKKIVGILLWNIFGKIPTARKIIGERRTVEDASDLAKMFNVHC